MICPSCQLINEEDTKLCRRCGEILTGRPALSDAERSHIRERSVLRGKIAELESREKKYTRRISTLRSYVILLLLLLPISNLVCHKEKRPTYNDFTSFTEAQFAQEQLDFHQLALKALLTEAPTFLYITQYGDTPEQISQSFYNDKNYADTILLDNQVFNDKRLPSNDTIILRQTPSQSIKNISKILTLQKIELIKGKKVLLKDLPELE